MLINLARLIMVTRLIRQSTVLGYNKLLSKSFLYANKGRYHASSAVRLPSENSQSEETKEKWPKRKIALVMGYVGTKYSGLQMDANSTLVTIESELEKSLHKIGCISDTNHKLLSKIGWSRSSRTDKGVHCGRMVISAKLLINPKWINDNDYNFKGLVNEINDNLPNDIRVFSCNKVNNAFHAREACTWREYEYLFPVQLITQHNDTYQLYEQLRRSKIIDNFDNKASINSTIDTTFKTWSPTPTSPDELINNLNEVFKMMEGSHK
jgi:tRNA pseudouridine(38-40) synthase